MGLEPQTGPRHRKKASPAAIAARCTAGLAALAVAITVIVTLPATRASGAVDALSVQAAPVAAADLGSPALDKFHRAAALSTATARADTLSAHREHLARLAHHKAHLAHLARLARQAQQARIAAANRAQALAAEQHAAKKAVTVTGVHASPAPSRSSGSSGSSGCSDPSGHLNRAQMTMLWLCAGGPSWAVDHALRIATCESGWWTAAHNPSGATGLWQILGQVTAFWGNLYDAHVNALNAVAKFKASGDTFAQWVCT